MKRLIATLLLACASVLGAQFEAGVARVRITPPTPFWLSGYAARTNPAPVVLQDLWAKALALRDPQGHQAVLVTMDLIGLPHDLSEEVAARAHKQYRLDRSQLLLNFSHTHSGPKVGQNLSVLFNLNAEDSERVRQYSAQLADNLVRLIGDALRNQSPAELSTGNGSVGFAVNRRLNTATGFRIGVNTNGVVDHTVPVLRVSTPDGQLRAVLFGYACHNTTLGGDSYQINGDYAGHAQAYLEQAHPGVTALFLMLCGADQNPSPRGTVELVRKYGQTLATEVDRVLSSDLRPVRPPLRTARKVVELPFDRHTRDAFEKELASTDKYRQRRARLMLDAYDRHSPVRRLPYPIQAFRLNQDFTLLSLAGEVVIDYNLRAKREFAAENLVVSGYCHEVPCYIPSRAVLREGGYEPVESMIYYGLPGPFTDAVEEKVFSGIRTVLRRVGAKPTPPS